MRGLFLCVFLGAFSQIAGAGIIGVVGTTAAPPPTLGAYSLHEFAPDPRPLRQAVSDIASPLGGTVGFDLPFTRWTARLVVPRWSHGYEGDVYYTYNHPPYSARTFDLTDATAPELGGVGAFRLAIATFIEADVSVCRVTATTIDGDEEIISFQASAPQNARWIGFHTTDGDLLQSVRIEMALTTDFIVGEFAISAIPEPGTSVLILFSFVASMGGWRAYCRRSKHRHKPKLSILAGNLISASILQAQSTYRIETCCTTCPGPWMPVIYNGTQVDVNAAGSELPTSTTAQREPAIGATFLNCDLNLAALWMDRLRTSQGR